jgi:hypothetical protein
VGEHHERIFVTGFAAGWNFRTRYACYRTLSAYAVLNRWGFRFATE